MDFANWNIHNSVILIDEIELHLHPPMQQALLRTLPKFLPVAVNVLFSSSSLRTFHSERGAASHLAYVVLALRCQTVSVLAKGNRNMTRFFRDRKASFRLNPFNRASREAYQVIALLSCSYAKWLSHV